MRTYPKIRIKGFTDPWEQRKLSEEFSNFIVPMRDKPKEFGGNIPWTRIEDIEGKYLNGSLSGQYVTEETVKKMNLKIIPKDSLIVSSSATFGVVAVVKNNLITNQTFIGLVPNDKETLDYWYSYFQSDEARMYMKLQSAGSTIFYIAREHFENMPITVPTKKEMIKIGAFFSNLDDLITLHQRKCESLKLVKKSFLEKLFPKDGEIFPELRFKGFTDPWEQRKVSDLFRVTRGYVLPATKTDGVASAEKPYPVYSSQTKDNGLLGYYHNYLYENAITWTTDGANAGTVNYRAGKFYCTNVCGVLLSSDGYANKMVAEALSAVAWKHVSRVGNPKLMNNVMSQIEICVPKSIEEQKLISEYLDQIDRLITLHQRKCDALKNAKKYFLHNMFV